MGHLSFQQERIFLFPSGKFHRHGIAPVAAAKEEVGKPFLYEEELRSKNARLVELDTLLNIDGKGQAHTESVVAKSTRPSVLDNLKRPVQPRSTDKKPKQHEEVR